MATVTEIRQAIADRMSNVYGLRTSGTMLDDPKPPVAMVLPERVEYDLTARRGADRLTLMIQILVSRADDRAAQNSLDRFILGDDSVKNVLFEDPTLGGVVQTSRVTEMRSYGQVLYGETLYLGCELTIEVYP